MPVEAARRLATLLGVGFVALACTGQIGPGGPGSPSGSAGAGQAGGAGSAGSPATNPTLAACDALTPGSDAPVPLPLRRLSRVELGNTLRDLLAGISAPDAGDLPSDQLGASGFLEGGNIALTDARRLLQLAERMTAGDVQSLVVCAAGSDEATCAQQLIRDFGRRAFRRPLETAEQQRYLAFYQQAKGELGASHAEALRLVVQAMLQSPELLYHRVTGSAPPRVENASIKLTAHELASRLSYFLSSSAPDAELARAADAGELSTPAQLQAQAERLLGDPRAKATIEAFHLQWLKLTSLRSIEKSTELFPELTPQLKDSMLEQVVAFADQAVLQGGGLKELLTGSYAHVNQGLAPLMGKSQSGDALVRVELDPAQRAGILTLPAFLTAQSAGTETLPPRLGNAVYRNLLCQELPPVPAEVPPVEPEKPGLTTRDRFAQHSQNPCAQACHRILDPLGFAFEHYDPIGRYRDTDNEQPVDASGSLAMADGSTIHFQNAVELLHQLSERNEVRECVARQWTRFALGRRELAGDSAGYCGALADFRGSGFDIRQLMLGIVKARSFVERAPSAGEPVQ